MTKVEMVEFPTTPVAAVEYQGPEEQSYSATMKLVAWRREHGVSPEKAKTYGIHYSDPMITPPHEYRLDICVSFDGEVLPNTHGVIAKVIPGGRCACIRHLGSRDYMAEADYIYRHWLPASGEDARDYPMYFHYVNVGPDVQDRDMITDIYLPLRRAD
jgi:AraC family transcriptional regulator